MKLAAFNGVFPYNRKLIFFISANYAIEYCTLFLILFNNYRLAGIVFATNDKYPSTVYFELFCAIIYLFSNLLILLIPKLKLNTTFYNIVCRYSVFFSIPTLAMLVILMRFLPHNFFLRCYIFIIAAIIFAILHAFERISSIYLLINLIKGRLQYYTFANMFFACIGVSLFLANVIHKLADYFPNDNAKIMFTFAPMLVLGIISCLINNRYFPDISYTNIKKLNLVIRRFVSSLKEQILKMAINLIIGAFLIEWYFHTPLLLKIYAHWNNNTIDNLIIGSNLVALCLIISLKNMLRQLNDKIMLASLLVTFIGIDFIIDFTALGSFFISLLFILITICFNLIINFANRLVHYNIKHLQLNTFLLIYNSSTGIILFCFFFSATNTFLTNQAIMYSQDLVSVAILSLIAMCSLVFIYKIPVYTQRL